MSFLSTNDAKRTDFSFRNRLDPLHHKSASILEQLPVDMVADFVTSDPLHLLELGVMKRSLKMWLENQRFITKIDEAMINEMLLRFNSHKPVDFHRSLRELSALAYWKGTEFRIFLLYVGIVVLKYQLRNDCYEHFLKLFCAVSICYCDYYKDYISLAEEELEEYIQQYMDIYGIDSVVSNIHNLCHVVSDVRRFGPLNTISAYPFENLIGQLKTEISKSYKPLEQIARRLIEKNVVEHKKSSICERNKTVFPSDRFEIENDKYRVAFKSLLIKGVYLTINREGDKWFLTKQNEIVEMEYSVFLNNRYYIHGSVIQEKRDFFDKPFSSRYINIYKSNGRQNCSKYFPTSEIKAKLIRLQYKEKETNLDMFVFTPILHTLDALN